MASNEGCGVSSMDELAVVLGKMEGGAGDLDKRARRVMAFWEEGPPRTVERGWRGRPKSRVGWRVKGVMMEFSRDQA